MLGWSAFSQCMSWSIMQWSNLFQVAVFVRNIFMHFAEENNGSRAALVACITKSDLINFTTGSTKLLYLLN